jgi:putative spermidine/putrescine transport system substrate-binding protein
MATRKRTMFNRRRLLQTGGAVLATAGPLLAAGRAPAQAEARTVFVNTWGGSWTAAEEAAFFKPFTEATGVRVQTVAPVSYAKLKVQVQSGRYEFDVTEINQSEWVRAEREGLVEPIDWSVVQKD